MSQVKEKHRTDIIRLYNEGIPITHIIDHYTNVVSPYMISKILSNS